MNPFPALELRLASALGAIRSNYQRDVPGRFSAQARLESSDGAAEKFWLNSNVLVSAPAGWL